MSVTQLILLLAEIQRAIMSYHHCRYRSTQQEPT
jgi:hypothetical protein